MSQISLFKVFTAPNISENLTPVFESGFITQGDKVELFEKELQSFFQYPYILTLNSATSGLILALRMLNLQSGDEVISTALTCTATNWAILTNGLSIKWADVDPETCNISIESIKNNLTEKTKAIMVVHWGGYPVDLDGLTNIQNYAMERFGFRPSIIEDCSHAFGAKYNGFFVGTTGNTSVFSLQAIKHLTCGDGGLIFLPTKEEYNRAKLLRWYGIDRTNKNNGDFRLESDIKEWGYKFHMNDINASIGLANLPYIANNIRQLRKNALMYRNHLKNIDGVELMTENPLNESSYWLFTIKIINRNEFIKFAKDHGIMVSQVHKRNDTHSCVAQFKSNLPALDNLEKQIVCIPVGWWLTDEEKERILSIVIEWTILNKKTLVISSLSPDDKMEFLSLMTQLNGYNYSSENFFNKLSEIQKNGIIIVGRIFNKIICTGRVFFETKFGDSVAHIEDIVVDSQHRRQGFGKQIVKYLVDYAHKSYKIILDVKPEISSFYKACGFIQEAVQMVIRPQKKIFLLYSAESHCFKEMMNALSFILTKNNIENEVCTSINPLNDNENSIWFCIWKGLKIFPKKYILYNLEPLRHSDMLSELSIIIDKRVSRFVNYYQEDEEISNEKVSLLLFGYSEYYEQTTSYNCVKIDVLFIGGITKRREDFFKKLHSLIPEKRIIVINSVFDQREKNSLIRNSKIIISLGAHDPQTYQTNDLARMSEVLSNKGFMICESMGDKKTETKLGEYITYCSIDEFPEKVIYYLEHDEERNNKALIAYERFKEDFNLEKDFLKIFLDHKR